MIGRQSQSERDREFLQGQISYVRSLKWRSVILTEDDDHEHCEVCAKAIPGFGEVSERRCYRSAEAEAYLCVDCHQQYVREQDAPGE